MIGVSVEKSEEEKKESDRAGKESKFDSELEEISMASAADVKSTLEGHRQAASVTILFGNRYKRVFGYIIGATKSHKQNASVSRRNKINTGVERIFNWGIYWHITSAREEPHQQITHSSLACWRVGLAACPLLFPNLLISVSRFIALLFPCAVTNIQLEHSGHKTIR